MKRSRFSEEKIIGVLKEHVAGAKVWAPRPDETDEDDVPELSVPRFR